jgi:type IV secretion system protein VirB9
MRQLALCVFLAVATVPALALDTPEKSAFDARIRFVTYNPQDVVPIDTVIGIASHIEFEDGEQYVTHAFGDAKAWDFATKLNHVFVKPKADHAGTNLTIVTNRRRYYFKLNYSPTRKAEAVYGLAFRYPDTEAKKAQEAARKASLEASFKAASRGGVNLAYSMSGDKDIAPINVWDNREFTFFKFPGNRDLPNIYMVDEDGNESLVNRHASGLGNGIVVVHKVNAKWVIRLNDRALAVRNDAFDAIGVVNDTGTTSPAVERVIKGSK